ncbi:MAG: prepilin-type N-terminal cleavage/methylation domain-containing protein [Candidatus Paceibacterota bacterium]
MKNFIKKIINEKRDRGFTILETLVAIFILVLSITGPMVFAQSGLRTAFLARDQITSFFLAQDAVETIKNMRDNNALNGANNWLDGIFACDQNLNPTCLISIDTTMSTTTPEIDICTSGTCPPLKTDASGRFGYNFSINDSSDSRFTRNIYLTEVVPGAELQIVVEMTWTSNVRVGDSRIVVQENIFNWIPNIAPTTP